MEKQYELLNLASKTQNKNDYPLVWDSMQVYSCADSPLYETWNL